MTKKIIIGIVIAAIALFVLIQIVPYGRAHANPQVVAEPKWDSPQTRELAARACFDCHSNETVWPWYSNIAPVSWLIQHDVEDGRRRLNMSEVGVARPRPEGDFRPEGGEEGEGEGGEGREGGDVAELVRSGEMPPWYFTIMHPNAKLTAAEKEALIAGLQASGVRGD